MSNLYYYPLNCISEFVFLENHIEKSDAIIIPGSDEVQLIEKAVMLYNAQFAPYIYISGGKNEKLPDYPSEADFMRDFATQHGVPNDRIICENKAKNTFENARYIWDIIESQKMNFKNVILITKAYHSRRALLTFQRYFSSNINFYVVTVPGKNDITSSNWFLEKQKVVIVMGEVEKIGKYFATEVEEMNEKFLKK